jgi:hypothetical protein
MQATLGLGEPAWMKTVRKMTDVLLGPQRLRLAIDDLGVIGRPFEPAFKLPRLLGVEPLTMALLRTPTPPLNVSEMLRRYTGEPLRELFEAVEEAGVVADRWERFALWYLLSQLGLFDLRRLRALSRPEVEAAVLFALEAVVTGGEVVPAFRGAVARAPHLDMIHRTHLDHCLKHAGEGLYIEARI